MSMDTNLWLNFLPMWQYNHAAASGYGQFIKHLEGNIISRDRRRTLLERLIARACRSVYENSGSYWYHRESFMAELEAARCWFKGKGQVFHFLYGEQCFRYLGAIKRLGDRNFIVCTYHTPPNKFRTVVRNPHHLKDIDAVIVLSRMQIESLAQHVDRKRIHYVPRGVDTDYFQPSVRAADGPLRCLFVGNFLRDFETMSRAAAILERCRSEIHFTVVTLPRNRCHFEPNRNVEVLSGIPDSRLLELYQNSDVLVLPLLEATANNVILEALACGLPVITTDLPNAGDYLNPSCSLLVPEQDPGKLAETILRLDADRPQLEKMSIACRDQALRFSLEKTARRTFEVYAGVVSGARKIRQTNLIRGRSYDAN